ncbi:calcium-binding protein [Rubellimicrobium arenae]|uniref:calcium-binding protein n=1 Tax=Rubellimicrobium arenae TaxID=2817372 RepID=UPI001B313D3B|nr:calcium-binding protein [Rubellimicrobium arenae]
MAKVFANKAYNMTKYDFNSLYSLTELVTHAGEPYTVKGVTYQDQIEARYNDGSGSLVLAFPDASTGKLGGFFHSSSSSASDVWAGIQDFSVDFTQMGNAWDTPDRADDMAVLERMLSKADTFKLSNGNDVAMGFGGRDTMNGNGGSDRLFGGNGNDSVHGGKGDDKLFGEDGADTLVAGAGSDSLNGGGGKDILIGGTDGQRDVFVFQDWLDSMPGSAHDEIRNFTRGVDDINLRAVDADENSTESNEAFHWSGKSADEYSVWWKGTSGGVLLRADVSGDGVYEFEIFVKGVDRLSESDLIL